MSESFIPASEFETASNAVSNILGQPVEEIKITDILPPLNDIADSNKVFKGKLSVLFVDMRKSTDLTDELKSKKMVKVYRSFIRIVIQAIRYSGGYTRQFAGDGIMGIFQNSNVDDQNISSSCKAIKAARYIHTLIDFCLNPALKKSMDICIGCGVGICTGTIKTRDVVKGTIKAIDKSAVTAERMKDAYVRTKGEAEHGVFAAESSPEEYAADRTLTGVETAAHEAAYGVDKANRKGVKVTKQNISKAKEHFQLRKADLPKKPVHNTIKANSRSRQAFTSSTRKTAVKATTTAVKAVIAKAKALAAAIAAGGWVSVTVIIVVCLIGLIVGSCFGIFFSGEGSGTGQTMRQAVQEINAGYQSQIDTARANLTYDELEMSGSRAVWPEVLAVYAVKTTTDPNDPQEVATVDDAKKAILKDIFWQMNEISSHIERKPGKIITETDDGHGNIVETITTVTHTYLYITVSHKTAEEMADRFNFNADQRQQLSELLAEENRSMWSAVLYGIYSGDDAIVTVALSQIGNVGGQPYWSWYGFNSRVEWCACFVSWCANECGYIDAGIIPKYAGCVNGVQWFKDRGQWIDGSQEPMAGMIIFFDWDNKGSSGPQDGLSDHTGIVEKVENGIVYTVEGNSGDSCRINQYAIGHYEILGYGAPQY